MKNKISKLKLYRVIAGLTQAELAQKARMNQEDISRYELGKHTPLGKRQERIAQVLGKKVRTVFPEGTRTKRKRKNEKRTKAKSLA